MISALQDIMVMDSDTVIHWGIATYMGIITMDDMVTADMGNNIIQIHIILTGTRKNELNETMLYQFT